jgi:hypothetical protein
MDQRPRLTVDLGTDKVLVGSGDIAGCAYAEDSATAELVGSVPARFSPWATTLVIAASLRSSPTATILHKGRHKWRP